MSAGPVRVVVADDHPVFRDGLRLALAGEPGVQVVAEVASGVDVVAVVSACAPDVVLMDLAMPGLDGISATRRVVAEAPGTAVLVLTMAQDEESLLAALAAGARGYLLKGADAEEVLRAVRAVAGGEAVFGPGVAERVLRHVSGHVSGARRPGTPLDVLTEREREVLDLVAAGLGNHAIARRLGISPKTVRNHVYRVVGKLGAADRGEAVAVGRSAGLGDVPTPHRQGRQLRRGPGWV